MNSLFIHIYVGSKLKKWHCYEESWEKKCVKILEIHWRANNVGVFGVRKTSQNFSVAER
jgi:hypothetical protein